MHAARDRHAAGRARQRRQPARGRTFGCPLGRAPNEGCCPRFLIIQPRTRTSCDVEIKIVTTITTILFRSTTAPFLRARLPAAEAQPFFVRLQVVHHAGMASPQPLSCAEDGFFRAMTHMNSASKSGSSSASFPSPACSSSTCSNSKPTSSSNARLPSAS